MGDIDKMIDGYDVSDTVRSPQGAPLRHLAMREFGSRLATYAAFDEKEDLEAFLSIPELRRSVEALGAGLRLALGEEDPAAFLARLSARCSPSDAEAVRRVLEVTEVTAR